MKLLVVVLASVFAMPAFAGKIDFRTVNYRYFCYNKDTKGTLTLKGLRASLRGGASGTVKKDRDGNPVYSHRDGEEDLVIYDARGSSWCSTEELRVDEMLLRGGRRGTLKYYYAGHCGVGLESWTCERR